MRTVCVYYDNDDGKILAYSTREDPNFESHPFVLIGLDEMRKFYDGKASINSYEILTDSNDNRKLQKKNEYVYDESYVNDDFFEIKYNPDANFRVVCFEDCVVIFPCDIDSENPEFRAKLENKSVKFYFTKKDDPSILIEEVVFHGLQTSLTVMLEGDFTLFAIDASFTYSLEDVRTHPASNWKSHDNWPGKVK